MNHSSAIRVYAAACVTAIVLAAAPAQAQFKPSPLNDPATGEDYHIEGGTALWFPSAQVAVASERFGIPGTRIDFKADLGLTDQTETQFRLVLKPSRRSKFRFEFIPIKYESVTTLTRDIVFNGIRYRAGLPVTSLLEWKAYRAAYEFDFVSNDRGFAGFVVEAKFTDVRVELASPNLEVDFADAQAPIPAIGGIGRVYVVPNISITFELSAFKLPDKLIDDTLAHFIDWDLYGTVNFTNNVGAQIGYRSLDFGYTIETDLGDLTLKGLYFGIVARY